MKNVATIAAVGALASIASAIPVVTVQGNGIDLPFGHEGIWTDKRQLSLQEARDSTSVVSTISLVGRLFSERNSELN